MVLIFSVPVAVKVTVEADPVQVPAENVPTLELNPPTVAPERTIFVIFPLDEVNVNVPFLYILKSSVPLLFHTLVAVPPSVAVSDIESST